MQSPLDTVGEEYEPAVTAVGARGATAPDAAVSDATLSNRASNRCNERFELLSRHVDSLEMSFPGELSHRSANELAKLKEAAQSRDASSRSLAQLVVCDNCFEVRDKGAQLFPFVIQNDRFFIKLSRPGNRSLPVAAAQIRNVHLLSVGPIRAHAELVTQLRNGDGDKTFSQASKGC